MGEDFDPEATDVFHKTFRVQVSGAGVRPSVTDTQLPRFGTARGPGVRSGLCRETSHNYVSIVYLRPIYAMR